MATIHKIMALAQSKRAADIHIICGAPVMMRIGDDLLPASKEVVTKEQSRELAYGLLTEAQQIEFEDRYDLDFMYADENRCRYRVNISFNDGAVGAVIRLLAAEPFQLDALRLPAIVSRLALADKGLIL